MEKNLQNHYKNITIYNLLTKLNFKNIFEIPKITKICLNIGFKDVNIEKKKLINIILLLKLITNQKPLITKSKKNDIFLKIKKNSIAEALSAAVYTRVLGWSKEELDVWLAQVRNDMRDTRIHAYWPM